MPRVSLAAVPAFALLALPVAAQTPDVTVNWSDIDMVAYFVDSVSPPDAGLVVGGTGSENLNPTVRLRVGTRYRFVYNQPFNHPYSIGAFGPPFPSQLLLMQGTIFGNGTMENDPGVNWQNPNPFTNMDFTLTPALADAMKAGGRTPGYMCLVHSNMAGNIEFAGVPTRLQWPLGDEDFERSALGETVTNAFTGWSIVTGGPNYTAAIGNTPVGATGQNPQSTRWLTVRDNDPVGSNRVYPPAIITTEEVGRYTFAMVVNIESISGGPVHLVTQHFAVPYTNVAGIELTTTGANLVLLGTDEDGIGKAGASLREPLYEYSEMGFGLGEWVVLAFEIDLQNGRIMGHATNSGHHDHRMGMIEGLDLQLGAVENNFRWCIRNNAPGSVSVIHYDTLFFSGEVATVPSGGIDHFTLY